MVQVNDIIKRIDMGEYVLPEFQREYVWKKPTVKKFIQSLYKNYPTGTLLIWTTNTKVKLKGDQIVSESGSNKLILDGQQRLTTLYTILKGREPPFYEGKEKLNLNLYFNLDEEEFGYWQPVKMKDDLTWISVLEFFQYSGAGTYIEEMQKSEDKEKADFFKNNFAKYLEVLNKLSRIREYDYFIDDQKLKSDMEVVEVVNIFNLVNKEGRTLNEYDLALAHITMLFPEIKEEFRKKSEDLKKVNFEFNNDFFITALNAVTCGRGNFDNIYNKTKEEILTGWDKTKKSIDSIINILRTRAYINTSSKDELRSWALLIPLITYLSNNNSQFNDDKELNLALYWTYNAMIWGRYTRRGMNSPLEQDIVSINKTNEINSLINNLRREVRDFTVKPEDLKGASINHPLFNMTYILLKYKSALDWFTGSKLNTNLVGEIYQLQKHHIFPQDFLKKSGYYENRDDIRLVNSILNRAFLTQKANLKISNNKPSIYLKEVIDKHPKALKNQFVPENEDYWKVENFRDFLDERARLLTNGINKFLESLIEESEVKTDYKKLIEEGEGHNLEFKSTFSVPTEKEIPSKEIKFIITKSIAGFLNSDGGTLLIGVKDDGGILGLDLDYKNNFKENKDGFLMEFYNNLESSFSDKIINRYISYSIENIEGKEIMVVEITRSNERVFTKKNGQKVLFVRKKEKTVPIQDPEEIDEYIEEHWRNN